MIQKPIILIDDDSDDLEMLARAALQISEDYPVLAFADPVAAIEYLRDNHVDALFILSANRMQKMSGIAIRKEIIKLDGYLDNIPFYLMDSGSIKEKEQAEELNIQGYYTKPSTVEGIHEMMQVIFDRVRNQTRKSKRIVIIDDDKEDLELIKTILLEIVPDAEVQMFSDPIKALNFLEDSLTDPILIMSDVNMPKMDGYKLRTKILKLPGTIKDVPFVILSTAEQGWQLEFTDAFKIMSCCKKEPSIEGMKNTIRQIIGDLEKPTNMPHSSP